MRSQKIIHSDKNGIQMGVIKHPTNMGGGIHGGVNEFVSFGEGVLTGGEWETLRFNSFWTKARVALYMQEGMTFREAYTKHLNECKS